jgi:hypothetical protein
MMNKATKDTVKGLDTMNPYDLIAADSILYNKRLVRELNATPNGFYAQFAGDRCFRSNRARMHAGNIEARRIDANGKPYWTQIVSASGFVDSYGRSIVASRKPA